MIFIFMNLIFIKIYLKFLKYNSIYTISQVIQNADDQIAEQLTQMPPSPQKRFRMSQQPHDSLEPLDDEIAAHNRLRTLLAGPFSFAVALVTEIFFTCALRQHEHGSQDNSRTTFIYSVSLFF